MIMNLWVWSEVEKYIKVKIYSYWKVIAIIFSSLPSCLCMYIHALKVGVEKKPFLQRGSQEAGYLLLFTSDLWRGQKILLW